MMDNQRITKEEIARGYDLITEKVGLEPAFYDACLSVHGDYYGKILDIGCGRGFLLRKLSQIARSGTKFFGLDISSKLCQIAQENNPEARIIRGDAEVMPYPENSFDFVFMTEALEHMLDYHKALSEVRRVLKPGGIFIVTVPNRDWLRYDYYDKIRKKDLQPVDDHYFRFQEIKTLLEKNFFKILKYRGMDNLWYYGSIHKLEMAAAFFLPFLHRKMKRLLFKCYKSTNNE